MEPTERLDFADPLTREFTARVVGHERVGAAPAVVLDRSAFYPEGGGQLADRGTLGQAKVVDVQVDSAARIRHLVEGPLPELGSEVTGVLDWRRRRTHMALHTGQHILSRALADVAKAETVSSRLGEHGCTIDTPRPKIDDATLAKVEALTNQVVDDDLAVVAFFPTSEELEALPLRRASKVESHVRIVRVGDFDVTPCGGTHCTRSAQVGLVRIFGLERYKGGTRITFDSGPRARQKLSEESELLRALGREFTCGPQDVSASVEKLRRELGDVRDALGKTRAKLAERVAEELLESGQTTIVARLDHFGPEEARVVASRIVESPERVALLAAPTEGGLHVIAARGKDAQVDCGQFLKTAAKLAGGRGGGRPERAEGRFPADTDWTDVAARALGS